MSKVEKAYQNNKNNPLLQWMMFLLNPESLEISKIMEKNENIKVANYQLKQFSEDEVNQYIAELREKAHRDDKALFNTGKRIGQEQGLEQGIKQGLEQGTAKGQKAAKEQIAKNLLALGIPIEQISKATELSIEEIKEISTN